MAHSPATKQAVRTAYIQGMPLAQAAEQMGVSEATARKWRGADLGGSSDWDKLKSAHQLAAGLHGNQVQEILGRFLVVHSRAIEELENPDVAADLRVQRLASLTDSLAKTMSALGRAAPELSRLGIAMDVLRALAEFIKAHHPKLMASFMEILEPFGTQLAKEYE